MTAVISISELWIYPIKGCRGVRVEQAKVEAMGLADDRRWLVVDGDGLFASQRHDPLLATVEVTTDADGLVVAAAGRTVRVPRDLDAGALEVRIWRDTVSAIDCGDAPAELLSELLGRPCRLVRWGEASERPVEVEHSRPGDRVGFADAYPLLLIGQASLDDLNRRLAKPVPMTRFRPNMVVAGAEPYAEDGWARIRCGRVILEVVKPCARCVVTTTDQHTGRRMGPEPLATLATYRRAGGTVLFGQNAIPRSLGPLRLGDQVTVEELRQARPTS
jgi:uncharacterized protein YcbX